MDSFTDEQKREIATELRQQALESQATAKYNQRWDILFKVILLILAIATTICSVFVANYDQPPTELSVAVAILSGISTALSAFAFSQFNFAARQQSWQKRADAFEDLRSEVLLSDLDKDKYLSRLSVIRSWRDDAPTNEPTNNQIN